MVENEEDEKKIRDLILDKKFRNRLDEMMKKNKILFLEKVASTFVPIHFDDDDDDDDDLISDYTKFELESVENLGGYCIRSLIRRKARTNKSLEEYVIENYVQKETISKITPSLAVTDLLIKVDSFCNRNMNIRNLLVFGMILEGEIFKHIIKKYEVKFQEISLHGEIQKKEEYLKAIFPTIMRTW